MTYTGIKGLEELELQLANGVINVLDFLNALPREYIPNKEDLIQAIKEKQNETNSDWRRPHDLYGY